MKTFLVLLFGLLIFTLHAEPIRVPLQIEASFEMPEYTNGTTIIYNITTNVSYVLINTNIFITNFYVTNIISAASKPAPIVMLPSNVIDGNFGTRLQRNLANAPNFSFANFPPNSFATVYVQNPSRFRMNFQTNGVFWLGPVPTNQARFALLIEGTLSGEIWITP